MVVEKQNDMEQIAWNWEILWENRWDFIMMSIKKSESEADSMEITTSHGDIIGMGL